MKKLLLIDTFNFLHRAYHALPKTLTDKEGNPTNAVYGVTSMLINVLKQVEPDYVVAAMDDVEPTFRVEEFTAYKAHRKPMEDDLSSQIPKVFEVIDAFGVKRISLPGYEADDVIGTMIEEVADKNTEVVVVSNDRDLWQLTGGNVIVMSPKSKGMADWISAQEVEARYGFGPDKIPEYIGLKGDSSDNIPGVHGIGEKTATKLIKEYGSIDDIYNNIDKIEPKSVREKLMNGYEQAMMSKHLATIIRNAPVDVELGECEYHEKNKVDLKGVLERYNFKSLIKRLDLEEEEKTKSADVPDSQMKLL